MNERVLVFGEQHHLVGTLLQVEQPADYAVITFNAGLIPRMGPHRLWVKFARELASRGVCSLRFDLSGQGDSAASGSTTDFESQSVQDIQAAMSEVQAQTGVNRFVLIGICSGAALSYKAALQDARVVACGMIDVYMYSTLKMHLNLIRSRIERVGLSSYIARNASRVAVKLGLRSAAPVEEKQAGALPGLVRPSAQDFAHGLQSLLSRGTKVYFLYTGSYLDRYNYAAQFDDRFKRFGLSGPITVEFDPDIDHTVTERSAQAGVVDRLVRWLG